jgi:cytochrome c oxidase assembly protein subunit 11
MKSSSNISAIKLCFFAVAMFGFGYALVPLYDLLCDVTGLNGKSQSVSEQQQASFEVDESRTITVEFITTLNQGMSWDFKPEIAKIQVHPGKAYQTNFIVHNKTNRSIIGQAIPSVAPSTAANHFVKTECFCFTDQMLVADQLLEMPVVFVVNPALPKHINTITLSYTYFDVSNTAHNSFNIINNT